MRTPATVVMDGRKRAAAGRERQPSMLTGMRSPSSSIRRIQSWPPSPSHVICTKSFAAGVRRFGDADLTLDLRADLRGGIALCWRSSCVGGYRPVRSTARNSTLVRLLVERERPAPVPLSANSASACLSLRKWRPGHVFECDRVAENFAERCTVGMDGCRIAVGMRKPVGLSCENHGMHPASCRRPACTR